MLLRTLYEVSSSYYGTEELGICIKKKHACAHARVCSVLLVFSNRQHTISCCKNQAAQKLFNIILNLSIKI